MAEQLKLKRMVARNMVHMVHLVIVWATRATSAVATTSNGTGKGTASGGKGDCSQWTSKGQCPRGESVCAASSTTWEKRSNKEDPFTSPKFTRIYKMLQENEQVHSGKRQADFL